MNRKSPIIRFMETCQFLPKLRANHELDGRVSGKPPVLVKTHADHEPEGGFLESVLESNKSCLPRCGLGVYRLLSPGSMNCMGLLGGFQRREYYLPSN